MFEIRDLGPMKFFLGVSVIRNFQQETVFLVQDTYREKLIKDYVWRLYRQEGTIYSITRWD